MSEIKITISGREFKARLNHCAAAQALCHSMPMTLTMDELNGNEKYCYLKENLPTRSVCPNSIAAGDLMLFGGSCLVLFYQSFTTSYDYTVLGTIENPEGLAEAAGSGPVEVEFAVVSE